MADDGDRKVGTSINLGIGKEIDVALAEVLRGLLKKPAEEAGDLLADSIGMIGDRIRKKRYSNVQKGLESTRSILDSRGTLIDNIVSPSEVEIHTIIDGMSVSSDDHIRELWAGLFASALSPGTEADISRPIATALSALTPSDARIIKFVHFLYEEDNEIESEARRRAGIEDNTAITLGDANRLKEARDGMTERVARFVGEIETMDHDLQISQITSAPEWADNLLRLGIIAADAISSTASSPPSLSGLEIDARDLKRLTEYYERKFSDLENIALNLPRIRYLYQIDANRRVVYPGVYFTSFGERLRRACVDRDEPLGPRQ